MEHLKELIEFGVIIFLIGLNIIAFTLFIERLLFFKRVNIFAFSTKRALELSLNKHLTFIGAVASNAPYIGLLGTVLAIMLTFSSMAQHGIEPSIIMHSLALALKATAVGIVVAILAVVFYTILERLIELKVNTYEEKIHKH